MGGRIFVKVEKAIAEKLFTALSLIISISDRVLIEFHLGHEEEGGKALTPEHFFDLASLTKPIVTATAFMKFCSDGVVSLDDPLSRFFPRSLIHPELRSVPLWAILSHAGGWKDYAPFYRDLMPTVDVTCAGISPERRKDYLLKALLEQPPAYKPLKAFQYSDLGYILAGFILEEIAGMSLDTLWERLAQDLGVHEKLLYFSASSDFQRNGITTPYRVVSTGWCEWRRRWLKGEVHDENCFAMSGVAGHAGLFGTARAVSKWLGKLFITWRGVSPDVPIKQDVIRHFWERKREVPGSTWAVGFDTPSPHGSTAGRFFSPTSVGHLGFTGTSFWLDLNDGFSVVLLTNRVYYPGTKERMRRFREEIHDLARTEYGKSG